jgi:hypothetical protein
MPGFKKITLPRVLSLDPSQSGLVLVLDSDCMQVRSTYMYIDTYVAALHASVCIVAVLYELHKLRPICILGKGNSDGWII